ncbi:MAG: DUF3667 domain-containing protein, partial [Betaproteobacteria bacterium]
AHASGHYCANCGQETRVALPTFGTFMREAAGRYVALDGRMWRTLWGLVARPGFLTREYLQGRRRRYIRPARLFLVLYLLLFALIGFIQSPSDLAQQVVFVNSDEVVGAKDKAGVDAGNAGVPPAADAAGARARAGSQAADKAKVVMDSETDTLLGLDDNLDLTFRVNGMDLALPEQLRKRYDQFKKLPREEQAEQLYAGVLRYGTYAMVALLPAFALLLKLAYLGRGSRYPGRPQRYAEHLVYSAHLHAFAALMLIVLVVLPFGPVKAAVAFWIVYYVFRARQAVYRGPWWAGLLRGMVIFIVYATLIGFAVLGLLATAVMLR